MVKQGMVELNTEPDVGVAILDAKTVRHRLVTEIVHAYGKHGKGD